MPEQEQTSQPLAIEYTTTATTTATRAAPSSLTSDLQKLMVDQDVVKLDALGPVVVNEDGTLSRITNWDKMTDGERTNTLRVLNKRNKARLERLRKEVADAEK
ncbi:hypothetical protein HDU76_007451 [Blyttiomyces sp. JEL0837]|nr:hypothetical protein HDU76_007451 [Blyttiomyces sp. JEL0837]